MKTVAGQAWLVCAAFAVAGFSAGAAVGPGGQAFVNNGRSVRGDHAPGSHLDVDGIRFELRQFHFHSPSENHFAHADADGSPRVLALLYQEGSPDAALDELVPPLSREAGSSIPVAAAFDAATLLPAGPSHCRLNGSRTA